MQQVVDLQRDEEFRGMDVQLLSISPDPPAAWAQEGGSFGITQPMLSDAGNSVWLRYGTTAWTMATNEPGHTFVLVDESGKVVWVRDYGAPENGGLMYVAPPLLVGQIRDHLDDG
jgi:peroxiredoxin